MVAKSMIVLDKELQETKTELNELKLIVKKILTLTADYNCVGMSNAKIMLEKL